jgi:predicted cupin superfamily sugar epimerase
MLKLSVDELIKRYNLIEHIEGGYYYRGYRSQDIIPAIGLPKRFRGERSITSAVVYLIPSGVISKLHRLKSDEIWHFYLGDPMTLVEIYDNGTIKKTMLGQNVLQQQEVQHVVHHGCWFGGFVNYPGDYSFVGCTVSPGFDVEDFEMGDRETLLQKFPHLKEDVLSFFKEF